MPGGGCINLIPVLAYQLLSIWCPVQKGAEHWGGERDPCSLRPIDQAFLDQSAHRRLDLVVPAPRRLLQLFDRRALTEPGDVAHEQTLLGRGPNVTGSKKTRIEGRQDAGSKAFEVRHSDRLPM